MTKWKNALAVSSLCLLLALFAAAPVLAESSAPGEGAGGVLEMGGEWEPSGTITITAPTDISDFPLIPGQDNTAQGTLKVTADAAWSVSVSDADPTTGGKMTNYTNSQYNTSVKLGAFMGVWATGDYTTGSHVTLPTGGAIASSTSATSGEVSIPVTFNQTVSWSDPVSAPDSVYRIVITFTGTA